MAVIKHGMTKTPTYKAWISMRWRCEKPQATGYHRYGGRGIKVCKRWAVFKNFFVDMGVRPIGTSIDRIDNNGNYIPENCRWATPSQQQQNTRKNRIIQHDGQSMCLYEWARATGLSPQLIRWRLSHGWSIKRTLSKQVNPRTNKSKAFG